MSESLKDAYVRLVEWYVADIEPPWDSHTVTAESFARWVGSSRARVYGLLGRGGWPAARDLAMRARIRPSFEAVVAASRIRADVSGERIAREAGTSRETVNRLMSSELAASRAALPTLSEHALSVMEDIASQATSLREFTWDAIRVRAESPLRGVGQRDYQRTRAQLRARLLAEAEAAQTSREPTSAPQAGAPQWRVGRTVVRRDRLREDLRDGAWRILHAQLASGRLAPETVAQAYRGFVLAGAVLGDIPDAAAATAEDLARAWAGSVLTPAQRKRVRRSLILWFRLQADGAGPEEGVRLTRVIGWLEAMPVGERSSDEVLSETELGAVIAGCVADIKAGVDAAASGPIGHDRSPRTSGPTGGTVVDDWSIALLILTSLLTGVRRESATGLREADIVDIRPGTSGLIWRHGKKREESLGVLPGVLARHLRMYAAETAALRSHLRTDRLFLGGAGHSDWGGVEPGSLTMRFQRFVRRHSLVDAEGLPLRISNTLLRRTFAMRALAEGRSIFAIAAQLNHRTLEGTMRYVKLDRYRHPAAVGPALDEHARVVLPPWHRPMLTSELAEHERQSLLKAATERDQGIGLCRHDRCQKLGEAAPPPCGLCEHLVTDDRFLDGWRRERAHRHAAIKQLEGTASGALAAASLAAELRRFDENLAYVDRRCRR